MKIYIIGTETCQKIGYTKDVHKRLRQLQTGNAETLKLHYHIDVPEARVKLLEKKIHKELAHKRISGEWFNITPDYGKQILDFTIIRWLDDTLL